MQIIARLGHWIRVSMVALLVMAVLLIGVAVWLWQDRHELSELDWPVAETIAEPGEAVTVSWLGVTTLLFDDGETQVLVDGFFSRFNIVESLLTRLSTDVATVNYAMSEFRINRLAAIIPAHSHFDHAMDAGVVANRSSAVVLGSESTANIVRGAGLPVEQYQILANRESRQFGDFTITLIISSHAPLVDGKRTLFPGNITEPLTQPARISDWKDGVSYSVVISHPRGTTLVQASAGYVEGNLADVEADVVVLGVAGLARLGRAYTDKYYNETVTATGAATVYPVHYDDFTRPFGEIALLPKIADDVALASRWIIEVAELAENPARIERLPFGKRIAIY